MADWNLGQFIFKGLFFDSSNLYANSVYLALKQYKSEVFTMLGINIYKQSQHKKQ